MNFIHLFDLTSCEKSNYIRIDPRNADIYPYTLHLVRATEYTWALQISWLKPCTGIAGPSIPPIDIVSCFATAPA